MTNNALVLAFAAALMLSVLASLFTGASKRTIQSYFWGDQRISLGLAASLLLSGSFSLNGLLYQAWLGYTIGWWSLAIQVVWCLGFAILAFTAPKFQSLLSRGTMHGIIAARMGKGAGRLAAIASVVGFAILIGWEAVVGATVLKEATGADNALYLILPLALVFVAGLYTLTGGLRGNAYVNFGQNIVKSAVLIGATTLLLTHLPARGLALAPVGHLDFPQVVRNLGGWALAANLAFSFFWQSVDMSVWQNLSATKPKGRILAVVVAGILIFVFPGLIGTLIGVGLSGLNLPPGIITDTNILNQFAEALSFSPLIVILLFAAFAASMLSTIDGYSLAAAQASTWDLLFPKKVKRLLSLPLDRDPEPEDKLVLSWSRLLVLVIALTGAGAIMALVIGGGISLFDLVYIVVVAQMSLVGPILLCVVSPRGKQVAFGYLPILAGLGIGGCMLLQKVFGNEVAYTFAPVGAILGSMIFTLITPFLSSPRKSREG